MRKIVWFQRGMIITLVSLNVLFYSLKSKQPLDVIVVSTSVSAFVSGLIIFSYAQLKKKHQAKYSLVKKTKN
jgi:nitrate reductase gamma subunit